MTREEAIRILNNMKPLDTTKTIPAYKKGQAFDMAIQALEQEQKTGHWINDEDTIGCYYCSECGGYVASYDDAYCKYCGARMVE